jgi:MFS transporter, DHA2 family, multidrug resistance protein
MPVAVATFATLTSSLRNEGTAIFSLMRNLGSSVGISVVVALLTRNTQIAHATLAERVTRYQGFAAGLPSARSLSGLNAMVTQQAAMIAYNDDFKLLLVLSLASIPLVFLLRTRTGRESAPIEPIAIE